MWPRRAYEAPRDKIQRAEHSIRAVAGIRLIDQPDHGLVGAREEHWGEVAVVPADQVAVPPMRVNHFQTKLRMPPGPKAVLIQILDVRAVSQPLRNPHPVHR